MSASKDMKNLIAGFERAGHTVKGTKAGYVILHKDGKGRLTMHLTLSDHRAMKNLQADAKRNGFIWPI